MASDGSSIYGGADKYGGDRVCSSNCDRTLRPRGAEARNERDRQAETVDHESGVAKGHRLKSPSDSEPWSSTGFSRRQFILSSVATGIAGVISRPALSAVAASPSTDSQNQLLTFEVIGDRDRGYGVDILFKRDRVARHNAGGEFSAVFQNTDRSRKIGSESWKASSWKGDHRHLYLQGEFQLPNPESS